MFQGGEFQARCGGKQVCLNMVSGADDVLPPVRREKRCSRARLKGRIGRVVASRGEIVACCLLEYRTGMASQTTRSGEMRKKTRRGGTDHETGYHPWYAGIKSH